MQAIEVEKHKIICFLSFGDFEGSTPKTNAEIAKVAAMDYQSMNVAKRTLDLFLFRF